MYYNQNRTGKEKLPGSFYLWFPINEKLKKNIYIAIFLKTNMSVLGDFDEKPF